MKNAEKTRAHEIVKKTAELEVEIANSAKKHTKSVEKNTNVLDKTKPNKNIGKSVADTEKTKKPAAGNDEEADKVDNKNQKLKKTEIKFQVEENWDVLKGKAKKVKPIKTRNVKPEKAKNVKKYKTKREPELANTNMGSKFDKNIKGK